MSNKTFHVANWHLNHRTGPPRPSGDREIVGRMERISKGVGWRGVLGNYYIAVGRGT
jgi:hypothetical protein